MLWDGDGVLGNLEFPVLDRSILGLQVADQIVETLSFRAAAQREAVAKVIGRDALVVETDADARGAPYGVTAGIPEMGRLVAIAAKYGVTIEPPAA